MIGERRSRSEMGVRKKEGPHTQLKRSLLHPYKTLAPAHTISTKQLNRSAEGKKPAPRQLKSQKISIVAWEGIESRIKDDERM